jgi:hypothetical protein
MRLLPLDLDNDILRIASYRSGPTFFLTLGLETVREPKSFFLVIARHVFLLQLII